MININDTTVAVETSAELKVVVANEVAETCKLQIGGETTITHNSVGNSTFISVNVGFSNGFSAAFVISIV